MTTLLDSVGLGGRNRPEDVKAIQRLLNRSLPGHPRLVEDGRVGPRTLQAINAFQSDRLGMRHPDGLVEPGERTHRGLQAPPRAKPDAAPASTPAPSSASRQPAADRPAERSTRTRPKSFVGGGVRETPVTTRIIDAITPSFEGERAKVISGYMNDEELFWKVNYHWDYLLWMVRHSLDLPMSKGDLNTLQTVQANLMATAPRPGSGYRTSPVGKPRDASSMDEMTRRHRVVAQSKLTFKKIIEPAGLKSSSSRTAKAFDYAVAPVAHPGTSKHGAGYALDISGDNHRISDICNRLGASLVFDEKSHVHVEFKNGVSRIGTRA